MNLSFNIIYENTKEQARTVVRACLLGKILCLYLMNDQVSFSGVNQEFRFISQIKVFANFFRDKETVFLVETHDPKTRKVEFFIIREKYRLIIRDI